MRTRLLCFLFALLAACASKTPEQELAGAIDPAASWVSALEFTCERWLDNRVPSRFVRETVKSAKKELEKTAKTTDASKANDGMKRSVRALLQSATSSADVLASAVERGDQTAVARVRPRFAAAYAALHQIEEDHK